MFSDQMRALALLLLLGTACPPKKAQAELSAIQACQAGSAFPADEHLRRCAGLINEPVCRRYILELDGGVLSPTTFSTRCQREYCARFSRPIAFCRGDRGTPADLSPELDFMVALFETDHGVTAEVARSAFFEAAGRAVAGDVARVEEEHRLELREARLIVDLDGDSESISVTFVRPAGVAGFSGPSAEFAAQRCRALVSRALDGGALLAGQPVVIRAKKQVTFRSVRCLMDAAIDAGATLEDVSFSSLR